MVGDGYKKHFVELSGWHVDSQYLAQQLYLDRSSLCSAGSSLGITTSQNALHGP